MTRYNPIPRDQNRVPVLAGVSSVDGLTPIPAEVNPVTGRLLVDSTGTITNTGTFPVQLNASQSNTTGAITASGQSVTDADLMGVGAVTIQLSGTYSGFNGIFETLVSGASWVPIRGQIVDESAVPSTTTGVLPDNTTVLYNISPLYGNSSIRLRSTALVSGTVNVVIAPSAQFGEQSVASMIYDGTNVVNVLKSDGTAAGQNAELVAGTYLSVPFTTTTVQAVGTTDAGNYRWVSVQITSQGTSSTVSFQTSNDNSIWINNTLTISNSNASTNSQGTSTTAGIFSGPINGRYFRLNITGISAGTTAGTIVFSAIPGAFPQVTAAAVQSGTWTVGSNSATGAAVPANAFYMGAQNVSGNLTGLGTFSSAADGTNGGTSLSTGAMLYNGTNYDRTRNNITAVIVAAGTTTTQSNVLITNNNASKLMVVVNIASGAGTVTLAINGTTSSGYSTNLLTSTALVGAGATALRIFPGATPSPNLVANDMIPRNLSFTATVVGSITYGVDYVLSL